MNQIAYEARKAVYMEAIQTNGMNYQIMMAIEEMSELTKEICKNGRGRNNIEAIAEEIADVTIMMEQLRIIFDINDEVCANMDMKVLRLADRLKKKCTENVEG